MSVSSWNDFEKGVEVKPGFGNQAEITYNGLLSKCGADQVYLHYGYGDPTNWKNVKTEMMDRSPSGWTKSISMLDNQIIFCFKDSANNWDNNNGHNWIARTW